MKQKRELGGDFEAFWYEYREDGSLFVYTWNDINRDGIMQTGGDEGESELEVNKRYWKLDENGDIIDRAYLPIFPVNEDTCSELSFETFPETDCFLRQEGKLTFLNQFDEFMYVNRTFNRFNYTAFAYAGEPTRLSTNVIGPEYLRRLPQMPVELQNAGL